MRESDGPGWSATTQFDQFTHAQLIDMVNGSAPASVSSIADTLNSASTQTQSIADDLNTHITHLQWDGAAGDSFRGWARQVVQAMDDLSVFHNNAGVALQMAGDTLTSVKAAMPPVPTADVATVQAFVRQASVTISPGPTVMNGRVLPPAGLTPPALPGQISQSDAYAAQGRVDAAHQEAIAQMEKLGGAYNGATQTMDLNKEPQFPPTPDVLMPPNGYGKEGMTHVAGPGGSNSGGGGSVGGVGEGAGLTARHGSGGGTVSSHPVGVGRVHQPTGPGAPGGISTLQSTHPPVAGPPPVHGPGAGSGAPGTPPGSGAGHGGGVFAPPGGGAGGFAPVGRAGGPGRGGRGGQEGLPPGEHGGEVGVHGGAVGGRGGRFGGGAVGGAAERGAGVVGAEQQGSSTARAGRASGEAANREGVTGAGTGEGAGGQMMGGGGMGGLGGQGSRGRKRGGRAAYLSEDQETWASGSDVNPAVVE